MPAMLETTQTLLASAAGDRAAADKLLSLVYDELRALAAGYLQQERPGHTLQPTDLVHNAYLRLMDQSRVGWKSRNHFFAIAATHMRRILVDHARARKAGKRGGDRQRVTIDAVLDRCEQRRIDLIDLDDALGRLAVLDKRQARIVELRLFSGLGVAESAGVLGVSERTVKDDFAFAKAWLKVELGE